MCHHIISGGRNIRQSPSHCPRMKKKWKKNEQVPILLPRASSNLFDAKEKWEKMSQWPAEIIQFIWYPIQF